MLLRSISLGAVVALALAACSDQPVAPHQRLGSTPHASGSPGRLAIHRLFDGATNDHFYSAYPYSGAPAYTLACVRGQPCRHAEEPVAQPVGLRLAPAAGKPVCADHVLELVRQRRHRPEQGVAAQVVHRRRTA